MVGWTRGLVAWVGFLINIVNQLFVWLHWLIWLVGFAGWYWWVGWLVGLIGWVGWLLELFCSVGLAKIVRCLLIDSIYDFKWRIFL